MGNGPEGGRERRKLRLNRETLRDLAPTDDAAAAVRGGTLTGATVCGPCGGTLGCPPGTTTGMTIDGCRVLGITVGQCDPGVFRFEQRIITDYEVLDDGSVVVRNVSTKTGRPKGIDASDLDIPDQ